MENNFKKFKRRETQTSFSQSRITKEPHSFRPISEVWDFLEKCFDKSDVINKSVLLWKQFVFYPIKLMFKLKKMYPDYWKYVNRHHNV